MAGEPLLGYARLVPTNAIRPGEVAASENGGIIALSVAVESDEPLASVAFEASPDGFEFEAFAAGLPDGSGGWAFTGASPPGAAYFRAVATDLRGTQAASEAAKIDALLPPVLSLPPRIYAPMVQPFEYLIAPLGAPAPVTAR